MRKILFGLLIVFIAASASFAYPAVSGEVSDTPQAGLWKTHLSSVEVLGAKCQIGANTYQYIRNISGQSLVQGEPVFTSITSADGFSVTTYEAGNFNLFEMFQGIVYCDRYGDTTIDSTDTAATSSTEATSKYGWIVTQGVCRAYVSGEGTDVDAGDLVVGMMDITSGVAVGHLKYGRDFWTALDDTAATNEAGSCGYPVALEGVETANAAGLIKVLIR